MSGSRGVLRYQRLRAPKDHGQWLVDPPVTRIGELLQQNLAEARAARWDCQGRPLAELVDEARRELVAAAVSYTGEYQTVKPVEPDSPIIMAGHQPELYHAGVWAKSFLLSRLARESGGCAINLLIDNDTLRHASIQVPTGSVDAPQSHAVPFDGPGRELPYEERRLLDERYFTSFADRVQQVLRPLVAQPLIRLLWPAALDAARRHQNLGQCLAEARHRVENEWGLQTLELPLSRVCDSSVFRWFVAHLIAHLPRFQPEYNAALHEFRRVNRIRSRTHPVPALAQEDDWLEAPLWIWSESDPRRERVFVRPVADGVELSDRRSSVYRLPVTAEGDLTAGVAALVTLRDQGVKLRPRALITTMYARLVLSDLFIHGIGGAKYDQLTDAIIERFFGLTPPRFVTATATAKLPIEREPVHKNDLLRLERTLRDLQFNPQRHLPPSANCAALIQEKQSEISRPVATRDRFQRHRRLSELTAALQPHVDAQRAKLVAERDALARRLRAEKVIGSREYSFCLFPEPSLRPLLLDI